MIWILAGNVAQAESYRRDHALARGLSRYIADPRDIRGIGPIADIRYVGTWRDRPEPLLRELHFYLTQGGGGSGISFEDWLDEDRPGDFATEGQCTHVSEQASLKDLSGVPEEWLVVLADIDSGMPIKEPLLRELLLRLYHAPKKAESADWALRLGL